MSLAKSMEESKAMRREHVLDALYYRRKKLRKAVQAALGQSMCEKLNQRFFLGDPPF